MVVQRSPRVDLRLPIGVMAPQFDIEAQTYRPRNPSTYLVMALCYDSLAGPSVRPGGEGIFSAVVPDYASMVPRLAESFREDPDGSWLLRLRSGLLSHSRHELTSTDIQWTFERAFMERTAGAYRWGLGGLD